jgi:hypothetical protein
MRGRNTHFILLCLSLLAGLFAVPRVDAQTVDSTRALDSLRTRDAIFSFIETMQSRLDSIRAGIPAGQEPNDSTRVIINSLTFTIDYFSKQLRNGTLPPEAGNQDTMRVSSEGGENKGPARFFDSLMVYGKHDKKKEFEKSGTVVDWMFPRTSVLAEHFFRVNRVEGLFLGIGSPERINWRDQKLFVPTLSVGYGFASHRWRYGGGLFIPVYSESEILEFGVQAYSLTDTRDGWIINPDENSAFAFFALEDCMDYFGREGFTASTSWYKRGAGNYNLRAGVAYVHDTYESLDRNVTNGLFSSTKEFREQAPINDGNLISLLCSAGLSSNASLAQDTQMWKVQAQAEFAGGFARGDFDFAQYILDVRRYQPLAEFLAVNLRTRIGVSDGDVPTQRVMSLGGVGTLPGLRYKELNGTRMILVNAEVLLGNPFASTTRGVASLALSSFCFIFFADAGVTDRPEWFVDHRSMAPIYHTALADGLAFGTWKSDLGIAIGSRTGEFRIGAAWRTDRAEPPRLVVRLASAL